MGAAPTDTWAQAVAVAATDASMRPSLLPDRAGANTALTLAFRFAGGPEGVPAPLSAMAVRLPAGLRVSLRGATVCPRARLQRGGATGCPAGALVGRGHAVMKVHAGSQLLSEQVTVTVFRGPDRGGRQTLELLAQGETPLDEHTIDTAVLAPDSEPYGSQLSFAFPPVPTLVLEPDASFASLSITLGGIGRTPRAHTAGGAVRMPSRCPAGGLPFAASFTFADGSQPSVTASAPCA